MAPRGPLTVRPPAGAPRSPARRTVASKWASRTGSWAATTTVRPWSQGSMAGARRATVGGSSDAVGSSSRRMGAGRSRARASATRWRSPALRVRPSWPSAVWSPAGRLASSSDRPTAASTRRRSASVASGAPSRRFSARVALKRWGRWGSQEKWLRHVTASLAPDGRPSSAMVPALGSTKRSSAASTVDLPHPEGPVSASRIPGGACREKDVRAGLITVLVVDAEPVDGEGRAAAVPRRRRVGHRRVSAGGGAGRDLGREHLDHPRRCRLPLGAGVELGSGPAQRDEDLRRHEEDGHGRLQAELPPEQPQAEDHGDEADAEAGDHVHGEGGEEGDAQGAHGGGPHALGGGLHLPAPVVLASEGAQRGEAFDELEEAAGQRTEPPPLALRPPGRLPTEIDHGDGYGEHQGDDHHERQPVLGRHPRQEDHGDDGGGGGLREVTRVVGVERAQAPGRGERQLAGPLPGQPARPEGQGVAQQLAAERGHDAVGGAVGREVARRMEGGPHDDGQPDDHDGGSHVHRAARGGAASGRPRGPGRRPGRRRPPRSARRRQVRSPATRRRPGTRAASSGSTRRGRPGRGGMALTG